MRLHWVVAWSLGEVDRHEQDHWAKHGLVGETLDCSESGEGGILGSSHCQVQVECTKAV